MKKWILILAFILIAQPGHKIIPALAEGAGSATFSSEVQSKDLIEIKKILEDYLRCNIQQDLDCVMSHVSKEFSAVLKNELVDYDWLKSYFESSFKRTVSRSFSNLNVLESNVSDNKVTILVEFNLEGFNLAKAEEVKILRRAHFSFVKENGTWKIISLEINQDSKE